MLTNLTRARKIPATATESTNFYFLVKICGISPLDIPYMSPFQVQTLIKQHNKFEEEKAEKYDSKRKEIEKKQKKIERNSPR